MSAGAQAAATEFRNDFLMLRAEIGKVIVGQQEVIDGVITCLLADGHVLLEGVPGLGKTLLVRTLSRVLDLRFSRIQFTPDLMPADIVGTNIVVEDEAGQKYFEFQPGPIFANIILADEINRATPKAQAALLECMEEFQVTVDGRTYQMPRPFFVVGTENPIEYEGTYPLPEAQLDRFLMRVSMGYPAPEDEVRIMREQRLEHPVNQVRPVVDQAEIVELQRAVRVVHLEECIEEYIVSLVRATRGHPDVVLGASPRGSLALMRCAQALAAIRGRDYVTPDDVKQVSRAALGHRLIARPDLELRGSSGVEVIEEALKATKVPVIEGAS